MADRPRVIAWAEPAQDALVEDAVRAADLDLVAVGSSTSAAAGALAALLDVPKIADLRQAAQRDDVDVIWLATHDPLEADARRLLRDTPVISVSTEPRPMVFSDVLLDPDEARTAPFVPLFRRARGYRAALDVFEDFGPRRSIDVCVAGGPGEGSLFARLFDAMDLLESLAGSANGIHATLAGPLPSVPEALADLHGHMAVSLRYADNICASIMASDCAGAWFRRATIVGEERVLTITDTGYALSGPPGEPWETGGGDAVERPSAGALTGMDILRRVGDLDPGAPPSNVPAVLAQCEAARLSCRTGQGETPQKLLSMRKV